MKKYLLIVFFIIGTGRLLTAQIEIEGNLYQHLEKIVNSLPGANANDYTDPNIESLNTWDDIINHVLKGEFSLASDKAQLLDYKLLAFTDTTAEDDHIFYILEMEESSDNHWGTYVFNPTSSRSRLIIQAPHPILDSNTGKQGAYIFSKIRARAFFLSGTHRCNSNQASSCSGTTSVCGGGNEAYRISDAAHNASSILHKSTEVIMNNVGNSVFLDLHGFAKMTSDPSAIVSNGTRLKPDIDYIDQLTNALNTVDNSLTFKVAHQDLDWNRLLGFTNTQGRLINGSLDPCNTNATDTEGRFIHFEQEFTKLRANMEAWEKLLEALIIVFPTESITSNSEINSEALVIFPNPTEFYVHINFTASTSALNVELYNIKGELLKMQTIINGDQFFIDSYETGIYFLIVKTNGKIIGRKKINKL